MRRNEDASTDAPPEARNILLMQHVTPIQSSVEAQLRCRPYVGGDLFPAPEKSKKPRTARKSA